MENKIPDESGFIKETDCNAKISDTETEFFTTSDYIKFTGEIVDAKIKRC